MLSESPDIAYWIDKSRLGSKPQARIRFTSKLLEKPLLRASLKQDPLLWLLLIAKASNRQTLTYGMLAQLLGFKGEELGLIFV
jgi:hypothetical protein